jgi:hypothetical protein
VQLSGHLVMQEHWVIVTFEVKIEGSNVDHSSRGAIQECYLKCVFLW